jgi:heptosyltransferase-2
VSEAVVIQTAWIGDVVLTTPLLAALARQHGPVDVVTIPEAVPLVETHPAVANVVPFDKRGRDRGGRGLYRTARLLARNRYRIAYHPQESVRSALLSRLARIPHRVGFSNAPGRWLYTTHLAREGTHEADRLLALASEPGPSRLSLSLTDGDLAAADSALSQSGIKEPFAVLAPGSARANKRWPYFEELASGLGERMSVVIVGGTANRQIHGAASSASPAPSATDFSGQLTIRQSAAVMKRARIAVTNDSAPLHIAQAVGTPTVAIFGPTVPSLGFGPRGEHDRTVGVPNLDCRPCSTHGAERCPLTHHRCMRDLDVPTVLAAVHSVLEPRETVCA